MAIPAICGAFAAASRSKRISEKCPSGQREQTVNLPASPTEVRILPPPRTEYAPVAQSVEHFHGKEGVSGSSPLGGSGDQGFEAPDPRECGGVAQLVRAAES